PPRLPLGEELRAMRRTLRNPAFLTLMGAGVFAYANQGLNFATSTYDIARGDTDGDGDVDRLYAFGGRSFTIWTTAGAPVFDSGSRIEREMLARGLWNESRSDDKGPEPESVAFGVVDGAPLLFVGLERTNAVMVYDVANPAAPVLVDVINVFAASGIGSTAPEGLQFLAASDNATGRALLAVTCEGNGATSLFAINAGAPVAQAFGAGCPANQPLTLASNLPRLANSWTLTATNANAASPFCTFWFGATALPTPVELTAIGAAGCFARNDTSLGAFLAPIAGGASSLTGLVPATPALLAYALAAQATTYDGTAFASSNGLAAVVGN
ncbi:MAG: choice-of-anchor I domain-containing protein, partial [Planctomycetota bacterium]